MQLSRESFTYITDRVGSFVGDWVPLSKNGESLGSFQAQVGEITGTWKVEASDDPRAGKDDQDARPVDITSLCDFSLCPDPTGTAFDGIIIVEGLGIGFIRLSLDITDGGTDPTNVWACFKKE